MINTESRLGEILSPFWHVGHDAGLSWSKDEQELKIHCGKCRQSMPPTPRPSPILLTHINERWTFKIKGWLWPN